MAEKPDCDLCEKVKQYRGTEEACLKCLPPLLPENREIYRVYAMVQSQYIMGFGGPVDIDIQAVKLVMDLYDVSDPRRCFELIVSIARDHISKMQDEKDAKK